MSDLSFYPQIYFDGFTREYTYLVNGLEEPQTLWSENFDSGTVSLQSMGFVPSGDYSPNANALVTPGRGGSGRAAEVRVKAYGSPAGEADGYFTKSVTVEAGKRYVWRAWVKTGDSGNADTDVVFFGAYALDHSYWANTAVTLTTEWQQISLTFTADDSNALLEIDGWESDSAAVSSYFYLDDMEFLLDGGEFTDENPWIDIDDVEATLDEGAAPFAEVTLTLPYEVQLAEYLDPRANPPMTAGFNVDTYLLPSWEPTTGIGMELFLRDRIVDHRQGTISVTLASGEFMLTDSGRVATTTVSPEDNTVLSAVTLVLDTIFGEDNYSLDTVEGSQTITGDAAQWWPGVSGWDYLQPICNANGLRLWCDEQAVWHLAKPEDITYPGQLVLATTNTVTEARDTISRSSEVWYEAVVVRYDWPDFTTWEPHVAFDTAGDTGSSRVLLVRQDKPYPGPGEAAARLRKLTGQGRVLDIEAVNNLSAYPAMAARLTVPDTPTQTGFVSAVTWRFPADEMQVRTRGLVDTPVSAWAAGDAEVGWADVPTGMSWDEFDWSEV